MTLFCPTFPDQKVHLERKKNPEYSSVAAPSLSRGIDYRVIFNSSRVAPSRNSDCLGCRMDATEMDISLGKGMLYCFSFQNCLFLILSTYIPHSYLRL